MNTKKELRHLRTVIAVSICTKFPNLFRKLYQDKGYVMGEKEADAAEILKALLLADPVIKRELEFYEPQKV